MTEGKIFEAGKIEKTSPSAEGGKEQEAERVLSPEEMNDEYAEMRSQLAVLKGDAETLRAKVKEAKGKERAVLKGDLRLVEEQIEELGALFGDIDSGEFEPEEMSMKPAKEEKSKEAMEE